MSGLQDRIRAACLNADEAFWAEIAKAFPEATTGDLDAFEGGVFYGASLRVIEAWVLSNVPSAETKTCG